MSSIKKLMCNPPAEMVASTGDYKVQGLFSGAGDALKYMSEEGGKYSGVIDEFTKRIIEIEERYMRNRQVVADNTMEEMRELISWIVTATRGEDGKGNGKDDRRPGSQVDHSLDGE